MAPEDLKTRMAIASNLIDRNRNEAIEKNSISLGNWFDFPDGTINLIIAMEEMAELQKELSKYIRNRGNKLAITEEIADVLISIDKIKIITGISDDDINKIINVKIDRMQQRDAQLSQSRMEDLSTLIEEETKRELEEEE